MASLYTPTNCCPNSTTIFASKNSATQHLHNSLHKGYCTRHRSHDLQPLQDPTYLHCAYCSATNPENTHQFMCLAALHQHIKTAHLFDLPVTSKNGCPDAEFHEARKRRRLTCRPYKRKAAESQYTGGPHCESGRSSWRGTHSRRSGDEGTDRMSQDIGTALRGPRRVLSAFAGKRTGGVRRVVKANARRTRRKRWLATRKNVSGHPACPAQQRDNEGSEVPQGGENPERMVGECHKGWSSKGDQRRTRLHQR